MVDKEMKLCECGCGRYAKPENRFINGHNPFYGKFHTEESKNKSRESHKKINLSKETLKKMSEASTGRPGVPWKDQPKFGILPENDFVNHHYMYDLNEPLNYTIKMTRSDHTKLHRLLQKLGYVVPTINKDSNPA